MSDDYRFRPDLKTRAQQDFKRAHRIERAQTPKDILRAKMSDAVQRRVEPIRERLETHIEKHKPKWVAREAQKLRQAYANPETLSLKNGPKPPLISSRAPHTHKQELASLHAALNVEKRCRLRLHNLNVMETRLVNRLMPDQRRTQKQ